MITKPDGKVTVPGPVGRESASQAQQVERVPEGLRELRGTKRVTSRCWHNWASWNRGGSWARAVVRPCQAETNSSKGQRLGCPSELDLKAIPTHPGPGPPQSVIQLWSYLRTFRQSRSHSGISTQRRPTGLAHPTCQQFGKCQLA